MKQKGWKRDYCPKNSCQTHVPTARPTKSIIIDILMPVGIFEWSKRSTIPNTK